MSEPLLRWFMVLADKAGSLGSVLAVMGCAMCFPALASLGAAIGLGFLSQWEGYLINTLLPALAWGLLLVHALGWFAHHQWWRSLLGMTGPALLLISLYPLFQYRWSSYVTYSALALMIAVSIWDLWSQKTKRCDPGDPGPEPGNNEGLRQ